MKVPQEEKTAKKYAIKCLQGTNSFNYTFDEPETEQELRERFLEQWNDQSDDQDKMKYEDFTLDMLADLFEVEIINIKD